MQLNEKKIKLFLSLAGNRLRGDWVIIGGSLLLILEQGYRVTNDIDIAGPDTASQKDTLILMEIAEELGLPVEAINQAGAFFLSKIPNWKKMILPIHTGKKATLYRPNATLYLLLKLPRLSESDLSDCQKYASLYPKEVDKKLLSSKIKPELAKATGERAARLREIKKFLQ